MNKSKTQNDSNYRTTLATILLILALPLASGLVTGCSTSQHRREAAVRVIDRQKEMLSALKTERESATVSAKIQADPDLARAEAHLFEAIRSLGEAAEQLKAEF